MVAQIVKERSMPGKRETDWNALSGHSLRSHSLMLHSFLEEQGGKEDFQILFFSFQTTMTIKENDLIVKYDYLGDLSTIKVLEKMDSFCLKMDTVKSCPL